jgi:hypothetical protein
MRIILVDDERRLAVRLKYTQGCEAALEYPLSHLGLPVSFVPFFLYDVFLRLFLWEYFNSP